MKRITFVFATLLFVLACQLSFAQILTKKIQSLSLKDLNGKTIDLASYAGKGTITVISVWATWCPPCIKEITNINNVLEEWQKKYGVTLVAISIDDARNTQKVKTFVNGKGWTFDVLLDPNGDVKRAFNFNNPPYCLLVDKDGTIVFTHPGYVEGDENVLEKEIQKIVKN